MRTLVLLILLLTTFSIPSSASGDANDSISQAVMAYRSALDEVDRNRRVQLFRRAETLFSQVIEDRRAEAPDQPLDADLYVNLGNAALGGERVGPAILAYRRALRAEPNHRRAEQNLTHARTLLPDWVPVPEQDAVSFGSLFDWIRVVRPDDWFGVAAIAFLITTLLVAVYLRTGMVMVRNLAIAAGVIWIASLVLPMIDDKNSNERLAVIVIPEVAARSADSINAPARFREPLPGGTEVLIVDDRDKWVRVQLFDSREAWLPASSIRMIQVGRNAGR